MKGVELLSFQALWFVVAGFVLGFATSTLWEWLYYRGKRRPQQEPMPPASVGLARVDEQPTNPAEAVAEKPATPWTTPYRSPRIYLESEQVLPAAPAIAAVTPAPPPEPAPPAPNVVPTDSPTPRLNPATLATLQATVADTPIAQTAVRHAAGIQPVAKQDAANTQVYDAPVVDATALSTTAPNAPLAVAALPVASALQPPVQPPPADDLADRPDHPDDLAIIKGVGEAYKHRLYNAGIYTWRQVAESEPETLRRITRAKPNANITGWRQQAQELAAKYQRQHTTFRGPLDDLTRIDGIGAITADLLYKAGICTYAHLADTLPDELAQIVPAPTVGDEIDFDGWINAAVRLANTKRRNQGLLS